MHPRDRRLQSEHEDMCQLAAASSLISFTTSGVPPVRYAVTARCVGLLRLGGNIVRSESHEFDIDLGENFPLVPPMVVWRTAIFHPNIKPPHVCSGNIWYSGMSLAEYCIELCKLIQYQSFNIYSVLNDDAGLWLWATLQSDDPNIPVDPRPITDLDFDIGLTERATEPDGQRDGDNG
jgi:ubiquitin-protein ligase